MVVKRCPRRGAEVEVALDAEAVEKIGDRLGFGGPLDDLQVADESCADVAFGLMNLDGLFVVVIAAWLLLNVGFLAVRVWVSRQRRRRGWSA